MSIERIDSSHLKGKYLERFEKIRSNVAASYDQALNAIIDKNVLPYIPTIHVTPFVVKKEFVQQGSMYRLTYYCFTFLDCDDFNKFAMYPSLNFLEQFPGRISANLAHEIAHVISFQGVLQRITKEQVREVLQDRLKNERKKEHDMESELKAFEPEFRKSVFEWNQLSNFKLSKDILVRDAWMVSIDEAEKYMFGDRYEELSNYMASETARALGLNL